MNIFDEVIISKDMNIFDEVISLYEKYGNEKYMIQEEITQKEHVLQAAYIADLCGAPEDVIIALLLHDIGQLVEKNNVGDTNYLHYTHDDIGRIWLENKGFPKIVCDIVGYHTLAKVVIVENDETYYDSLSEASKISYHIQKKKYSNYLNNSSLLSDEIHCSSLISDDIISARYIDDMAKIKGIEKINGFEYYREMVDRVLNGKTLPTRNIYWKNNIKDMSDMMRKDRYSFERFIKISLTC